MFQEAINYPRNGDSAIKNLAIGGLLLLFSFLLVPAFLVLGYILRALRMVMDGEEELPEFDEWGELLTDGLQVFAIGFVYALIPALIATVAVIASGASIGLGGDSAAGGLAAGLIFLVTSLVLFVVSLALAYVLPAAVVAFAREDRLGAAFSVAELRPLLFSRTYATGWLVAFGISFLAGIVIGVLNAVVIGVILAPFVSFYANLAGTHAIGEAVREMPAMEEGPDSTAGQPAV
ncbi:DUF4013 domain-containing protein [Halomicroarcula sp. GCM10025324]|uniref:DUF4013 domain-containing protein n=1 Tax=Haloarcula TaxID=2237 RepID=UPI0023E8F7FF|nr:DUF4013 domain-containing protein [Halomicroarcula sp. ZS-22-S1]